MRTITDIYDKYQVPSNLRLHMLRVAGAAEVIVKNWKGEALNRDRIIRVLLLHDIGNIVKMNFESNSRDLSTQQNDVDHWKKLQSEFISKYGRDDHHVSYLVSKEVGLKEDELTLMNAKIFINNDAIVKSSDYNLKVSAYVDQRAAPNGLLPLMDRLLEAKERYKNAPGSSMNNPRTDKLIQCAVEIEKQVLARCSIKAEEINDISVEPYVRKLRSFPI